MAIRQPFEIADQIGAPVPTPDYANHNWFFHISAINPSDVIYCCRPLFLRFTSFGSINSAKVFLFTIRLLAAASGRSPSLLEKPSSFASLTRFDHIKPNADR